MGPPSSRRIAQNSLLSQSQYPPSRTIPFRWGLDHICFRKSVFVSIPLKEATPDQLESRLNYWINRYAKLKKTSKKPLAEHYPQVELIELEFKRRKIINYAQATRKKSR
jgi:hypothetical protein